MSKSVLVTDPSLIEAVKSGDIEGDIYSDGECWVEFESASRWIREQPIVSLETDAGVVP